MRATPNKIGMTPPHPGAFIRDEILDELGLSVGAAAEALGVRRATLSDLINGNSALSPEMALRVEKAFGVNMETLLRMQAWHDAVAMRGQADEIDVKPYLDVATGVRAPAGEAGQHQSPAAKRDLMAVLRTRSLKPAVPSEKSNPAVPPKKSVTPDYLICLEDGRKFKSLKRHLKTQYNLSPEQYREKWGLPSNYPMVAPAYGKAHAALAKQMGLGQQGRMKRGART